MFTSITIFNSSSSGPLSSPTSESSLIAARSTDKLPPGRFHEYVVIGRRLPSETEPTPKLYRMRLFTPNEVVAKSRFWYFLMKLRKVKKANGEIVSLNVVCGLELSEGLVLMKCTRSTRSAR